MTSENLQQLIKKWENAKVDFKREWYWNNNMPNNIKEINKNELVKDLIALTNGSPYSVDQPAYLVIGIDDETRESYDFDKSIVLPLDKFKQQLFTLLNNYAQPEFLALEMEFVDEALVISVPPRGSLISLSKDLKLKNNNTDKKGTTYYRRGEDICVASPEVAGDFKKAYVTKLEKDKRRDNSTKESVLFQKWDESEAEKVVLNELLKYEKIKNNNFGFENKITHRIIKFSLLEDVNYYEPKKVAIIETSDNTQCHACGVKLSFIEFVKVSAGWIFGQIDINVMQAGSWGKNNDGIEIALIGKNIFGVIHTSSYGNQGIFSENFTLYTLIAGEYVDIFSTETFTSNEGAVEENSELYYDWSATVRFEETKQCYHNLILSKQGFRDKKSFKEEILYRFNEIKYEEIEVRN